MAIENLDTEEFDTETALADISSSLFGQDESGDGVLDSKVEQPEKPETPTESPAAQKTEETPAAVETKTENNSAEVQNTGAPNTWTKEALADWAAIPPRAQQEILKREQDMFKGLEQYKEKADLGSQYDKVVEPFRGQLAAENIDPVQLFQAFSSNHYLLTRGTPEQKLDIAANMMRHYQIDPAAILIKMGQQPVNDPLDPRVAQMQQELQQLRQSEQTRTQQQNEAQRAENDRQVQAFAADIKNIHFQEVASDMAELLKKGAAQGLQQAYEMAVWNNPSTRAKEVDRMAAEKASEEKATNDERVKAARDAKAANVKTSTKTRDGTMPVGSMDETLEETMAKIKARG